MSKIPDPLLRERIRNAFPPTPDAEWWWTGSGIAAAALGACPGEADGRRGNVEQIGAALLEEALPLEALAYSPTEDRLLDPHDALADLGANRIRILPDAEDRFRAEPVLLLRVAGLAAGLSLECDASTLHALVRSAPLLESVAQEMLRLEFDRHLFAEHAAARLDAFRDLGLLRRVLPELSRCYGVPQNPHHAYDVFFHSLAALDRSPRADRVVRLSALLHDIGKPETRVELADTASFHNHQYSGERLARSALRRLGYPSEESRRVPHLVRHHMFHYRPEWTDGAVRRFLREVGPENLDDLFRTRAADTLGNGLRRKLAPELAELRKRGEAIQARDAAFSIRDLAVHGRELMSELGLSSGPHLGRILRHLVEWVLADPTRNEHDILIAEARKFDP